MKKKIDILLNSLKYNYIRLFNHLTIIHPELNKNSMDINDFEKNTIESIAFKIEDVIGDGACMFRSIANSIYYSTMNKLPSTEKIMETQYKLHIQDLVDPNKNKSYRYNHSKIGNDEWGYNGNSQELLAKYLQRIALKYIFEHENESIEIFGEQTLKNITESVHEMEFDDYIYAYQYFSGDEYDDLEDRWGGSPEQYALSQVLERPIYVYTAEKWNKKKNKIHAGTIKNNKFIKGVRLRPYCIFNKKVGTTPIYILWSRSKNHYYTLIPKY